ncbi:MAG TPA: IclR family transcriptional regulator [Roseiarcus sp.]|jgi:DNA-binding IclR family transcriptional regulator|nr:IclR family transcriptional regulator [Roseiarcus sp.]
MPDSDDLDRYRAPALDKGLDILELLAREEEGLSQAEIAKALGRTPNEHYRMLERLVRRGYVFRNPSDRYELTLKLFGLAHFHRPIRRLVSQATPLMSALAARTMQANHLTVYDRASVTVIAQMDAPRYWGLAIRVGARVGLFNTGSGHVLLAFRSAEERAVMIAEQDAEDEDETPPEDIEERIMQIRERGYEVMPSQQTAGVYNLSAPVLDADNNALAALTCPYIAPLNRPKAPDIPRTIAMLRETAAALSLRVRGQVDAEPQAEGA